MQALHNPTRLVLSASDLSSFVGCRHRTALDLLVTTGKLDAPPKYFDAHLQALREKGDEHERRYVEQLRASGLKVVDVRDSGDRRQATLDALRQGVDVVVQGLLEEGTWRGFPDILQRVETPSGFGEWSYEVQDTKLARETRGSTILQLSVYSALLETLQGCQPEAFHVVTPGVDLNVERYRVEDYSAYFRLARRLLESTIAEDPDAVLAAHYPEPVEHCDFCRWSERCAERRRSDDHLSFIAGASRLHRDELVAQQFPTLASVAGMSLPVPFKPSRGSGETYRKIREQARVQFEQRTTKQPVWEVKIPPAPGAEATDVPFGLCRLPEPSPGDIFVDLEAARFAREGGREYLFGIWTNGRYHAWWAHDDAEERAAFESVVDRIVEAWDRHPGMHVYHFAPYEPSALKRLEGRYGTRTAALDRLLRAGKFVDLFAVTRQAVRAGVESYSIKALEQYYGFMREATLRDASLARHAFERAIEAGVGRDVPKDSLDLIALYNADDCRSTEALRDWLEGPVRQKATELGFALTRPTPLEDKAPEVVSERDAEVERVRQTLLAGIGGDPSAPTHPQHTRWMLAYLIDWHRREERASWWEYLSLLDVVDQDDLLASPRAIAGVTLIQRVETVRNKRSGKPTGSVINRYGYPAQEIDLGKKSDLMWRDGTPFGERFGELQAHDRVGRTLDIKVADDAPVPDVLFVRNVVQTKSQEAALKRLAEAPEADVCGIDLLHRRAPRLTSPEPLMRVGESVVDAAVRIVTKLDRTVLSIQGPPGAGKTYAGAHMIRALVRAGKRVGVTANSHRVICNLLEEMRDQARKAGEPVAIARKGDADDEPIDGITLFSNNKEALSALKGDVHVLGGTAWLWAREDAAATVDVLFVDEAGQMSLANVLAVSQAADSVVLLGDPQQLQQPQKGSHPDGIDVSALEHVLDGAQTMPEERGLFMPVTWRMAPAVCRFTSEVFYEAKLEPTSGLERQVLAGTGDFDGAGLWVVPVAHSGNQNGSPEEVDAVRRIVDRLLGRGTTWTNQQGLVNRLLPADILLVSPYNVQVNRLTAALENRGVACGTV
ncbi:MAG TPA: TM0106 family RecB-like putative nuclease, partial [Luteitalea sp.]|nr:TM0106 family RecB-like putative nuclease [Luteitalea sp.]